MSDKKQFLGNKTTKFGYVQKNSNLIAIKIGVQQGIY